MTEMSQFELSGYAPEALFPVRNSISTVAMFLSLDEKVLIFYRLSFYNVKFNKAK